MLKEIYFVSETGAECIELDSGTTTQNIPESMHVENTEETMGILQDEQVIGGAAGQVQPADEQVAIANHLPGSNGEIIA